MDKDVIKILKGLQQAASNAYDGALTDEGKPIKTGLKREEGSYLSGHRLIDGFNIRIQDNKMILNYQSEITMKEYHDKKFEDNITGVIGDVITWLKKEYKKVTGESVSLTMKGKPVLNVESTSRIRSFVTAQCIYEIKGLESSAEKHSADKAIRDFLDQGKSKSKGFK
jgi:hypothetical protein